MSDPQPLPSNEKPGNTPQGILSNVGCPDIPLRQAARSAFNTVVRLVGLEGPNDEENAETVLLNEECDELPDENVGQCARSGRRKCPKCPPPPLGEYTKSAIQAISNLLGLQTEPVEEVVNTEENDTSQENDSEVIKAEAGSDVSAFTDANSEESHDPSQKHAVRSKNKECSPPPFGETTRYVANVVGQYIRISKEVSDTTKPDDGVITKEESTQSQTEGKEQAVTKADLEKPACPPKLASCSIGEEDYTQTDNQLSIVTRSAYQTVVRLIGVNELPEKKVPEPELVSEEREDVEVSIIPDDRTVCRTCARYGRKKCAPPPLGEYTKSAIRTISNIKDYMRRRRLVEVSKETNARPEINDEKSTEETYVLADEQAETSSSSKKPHNYSMDGTVHKQLNVPLEQATRSAFQATVHLAGFDNKPRREPEMVNAIDNEVTTESENQETTKLCSKHGRKKCPPPPFGEYTKSAIQGISNLIGIQKADIEENVSNESNDDGTEIPPASTENATTAGGQSSGEESSDTTPAGSTWGQCRSKCSPPPFAESTRSVASAIGRFIGLGGEEVQVGGDLKTQDANAEVENSEPNVESQAAGCQPTSYKRGKMMHNRTMTLNGTTNAMFRMFGRMLGTTREGVYVPTEREGGDEEKAEEIQEEDPGAL